MRPLHFEQTVDVFHGQDVFGNHDVDQAGQLIPGILLFDGVADDPFLNVVAHHGSGELHPLKCAETPVDKLYTLIQIKPYGGEFCIPGQGKPCGAGRNAAV